MEWITRCGEDVESAVLDGTIETLVPNDAGIYAWKLFSGGKALLASDPMGVLNRIRQFMTTPHGETGSKRLSHSLELTGFILKGQDFTEKKLDLLKNSMVANPQFTQWMINYLHSLDNFLPSIYVGQSLNLCDRTSDHVSGTSDFGKRILQLQDDGILTWADLSLSYCVLKKAESELLSTIEYMTQSITIAGFTGRAG